MRLNLQMLARAAAVALVAGVGAVAAMRLGGGPAREMGKVRVLSRPGDPLATDLLRCAQLGRAAIDDWLCRRIWAESRERFLAPGEPATIRKPAEMFPAAPQSAPAKDQSRITDGMPAPMFDPDQVRPSAAKPEDE